MIMMTINKNSIDFCTYVPDEMKIIEKKIIVNGMVEIMVIISPSLFLSLSHTLIHSLSISFTHYLSPFR